MNKAELQEQLRQSHLAFIKEIQSLTDQDYRYAPAEKWTPGQQLDHLIKSIAPVNLAFSFPQLILRIIFGSANRPSRTYPALVEKYKLKLAEGGRAPARFVPNSVEVKDREALIKKLNRLIQLLNERINSKSEKQLDILILPHPLLGKLTLREMIYFTIYHARHHHQKVIENLKG